MNNRILIAELHAHATKEVTIAGWVSVRRDQGKLIFLDIRDRSGAVQCVVLPNHTEALESAKEVRSEWVLEISGIVNNRPEKNVKAGEANGDIEIEITGIKALSKAEELPFELESEVNLDTYLDYLPYTVRTERSRDIFKLQASILEAYRASLRSQGFTEFMAPALVGGDAEGGAAVFSVNYFNDHKAYLATSPQFYKQIMVAPFERSFTTTKVFRAEKSATTRHLSEITQMDFEMGFIENELEPMMVLERILKDVVRDVSGRHKEIFTRMNVPIPLATEKFPILTLTEAQEILEKEFDLKCLGELDLEPEHERKICEWAVREHQSDFVFITRFPTAKRAFYTYEEPSEAPFSRGFDLLFRGLEINSGAQRIHDYDTLVARIRERGMDPEKFSYYLQAFKYGMPPHGGSSTGLERLTARMLNLANVKEATAFPRDMNRIDTRLSE